MDERFPSRDRLDGARTDAQASEESSGATREPMAEMSLDHQDTAEPVRSSHVRAREIADRLRGLPDPADLSTRYEVHERLGAGGMGEVWRGFDRVLQRPVAIKRIRGALAESRQGVERFLTEARAIAALNHPNIVQVFDFGRDGQGYFLVMELVEGESLAQRLGRDSPMDLASVLVLGTALCDALALAHARGVVHRDIKPSNILLAADGAPKLGDFGVARLEQDDSQRTSTAAVLGTWDYMAPEQRQAAHLADGRSDLWSLAATLYQALTGRAPRVIHADCLPDVARAVLLKALEDDPERRYQSAGDLALALRAVAPADAPLPVASVRGKCPSCARMNALDRVFCGGCGASLTEPCMKCGSANGLWEEYCGKCGIHLADHVEKELSRIEELRRQAMVLRSAYRFEEAAALLAPLAAIAHPRLAPRLAWVATLLTQLRDEEQELRTDRDRLCEAAQEAMTEHRYHEALRLLDQIPEPARDERVEMLLWEATAGYERLNVQAGEASDAHLFQEIVDAPASSSALPPSPCAVPSRQPAPVRPNANPRFWNDAPVPSIARNNRARGTGRGPLLAWSVALGVGVLLLFAGGLLSARLLRGKMDPAPPWIPPGQVELRMEANSVGMTMVLIPAGEFTMGSSERADERPPHRVRITKPFWLGIHEVTVGQFHKFVEEAKYEVERFQPDKRSEPTKSHPMTFVSWEDATAFCDWLSKKEGEAYRLPTEAEWEYACRAGTQDDHYLPGAQVGRGPWHETAFPVGEKTANSWWLHDMRGNVSEWCADAYAEDYYRRSPREDPSGPPFADRRVVRGGSWADDWSNAHSSSRRWAYSPAHRSRELGFRVARSP